MALWPHPPESPLISSKMPRVPEGQDTLVDKTRSANLFQVIHCLLPLVCVEIRHSCSERHPEEDSDWMVRFNLSPFAPAFKG